MTLLAPAFLVGLLAVGLPLWLHRLSADNPNKQRFSSLMFLEPGEPRRVLAKQASVFAIARASDRRARAARARVRSADAVAHAERRRCRGRPAALDRARHVGVDGLRRHVAARAQCGARRDRRARGRGSRAAHRGGPVDPGARCRDGRLPRCSDRPSIPSSPVCSRIDYGQLMRSLDGLVRAAQLPVVVDIVTDAQQTSLPTRFGELAPRGAAQLEVHDVAAPTPNNWVVESFGGSALTGELTASVRSFASEAAEKTLTVMQNGKQVAEKTVQVPAHGRADVQFDALDLAPGGNRVTVAMTPGDELPVDDERYLALRRAEPRPVMLVAADQRGRGALFANAALGTLTNLALTPETHTLSDFDEAAAQRLQLDRRDRCGAPRAGRGRPAQRLCSSGRGSVTRVSDRARRGSPPCRSRGRRSRPRPEHSARRATLSIGEIDATHPALRGVERSALGAVLPLHARHAGAPTIVCSSSSTTARRCCSSASLGAGRVLLFTSSLDREWNDLPVQPAFVPFVAGLATICSAARGSQQRGRARQHAGGARARAVGWADLRPAWGQGARPRRRQ